MSDFERDQREWLAEQFISLTSEMEVLSPSEWAEQNRYLPPQHTSLPGPYRFDVTPYYREVIDCFSIDSPIREVTLMKGVQVGATTLLENVIGYGIDHIKTAPMMIVTADDELSKIRLESNIIPMLNLSGLADLITSADEGNNRKTGKTQRKIDWVGGGSLIPLGAQNPNKFRQTSVQILLNDEVDAWPLTIGKDGDPYNLVKSRTAAYEGSRKIFNTSTPLVFGTSKIERLFKLGDQRYYYVCCLSCGFPQILKWRHDYSETGVISGMTWETEGGQLVPGSVRYLCKNCSHEHFNDDKTRLFSPDNGAEWRPKEIASSPDIRSYHLSALYSPIGMQTWEACAQKWLEAWDVERSRPKDMGSFQVFYNNVLGKTFVVHGDKVRFDQVSPHKRDYARGNVPNVWASQHAGGPISLLTCSVDVHKENLAVAVFGWCRGRRVFLIDYWKFEGNTEELEDAATWGKLRELIETKVYVADDGRQYRVAITLIDSGYRADDVYQFAGEYQSGVFPIKGREATKSAGQRHFTEFHTPHGLAFGVTVDFYKDRWASALRRGWDPTGVQPEGHFNVPFDVTDKQLKELTVEVKSVKRNKTTNQPEGWEWRRPPGAANELWDTLVYANAALDMVAWNVCQQMDPDVQSIDWHTFFNICESRALFFSA